MQTDSTRRGRQSPSQTSLRTVVTGLGLAAIGLAVDQGTKLSITSRYSPNQLIASGPVASLVYVTNTGGVCGYAEGANQLLAILGAVTALLIGLSLFFIPNSKPYPAAFGLLLAGAAGNLVDRIRLGHVIDYISLDLLAWPAFNIADLLIVTGIGLLGLRFLIDAYRSPREDTTATGSLPSGTAVAVVLAGVAALLAYLLCIFRPFD